MEKIKYLILKAKSKGRSDLILNPDIQWKEESGKRNET